jgi:hypothetical protein
VADSTHAIADVNLAKKDRRPKKEGRPPRDDGSRWGGKRTRRQGKKGQGGTRTRDFGYKMHTSLNPEAEMITSIVVTEGNGHDRKHFPELVRKDGEPGLSVAVYSAGRGCDDKENQYLLETMGLRPAILLHRYRMEKKDGMTQFWIAFS